MSNYKKAVLRFSDKQLIFLFGKLSEELGSIANYSIDGISSQIGSDDERLKQFLAADVSVISAARVSGVGFSVSFQATDPDKQPYYSVISVNTNDGYNAEPKPDAESIGRCHLIIGKFIKRQNLDPGILGRTPGPILEPHVALLSKIESSAADQIEKTNEFVQEITSRFDIRGQELEARYAARRQKLEDEIAAKEAIIHADQQRLEERKKELDDRTNTHARRAIREDLVKVLRERQSQFTVSNKTRGLRAPVHIVFVTLLASTLVGALWSLYVWGSYANDSWGAMTITSAVKTAIFSFGFLTSAGLYISWMTRWSDKHADSQFQLAQFEIDINRASWAVEAALEWKGAQGEQMPEALLAGITKHLFEAGKQESADYSPLEALASSILGSASNLKLNMNGSEVAYDRKSMKELKNASS
ncbi:hypothetical protein [Methylorubrum thiocyanatum]|uniref:hypothetical protein n=1 Tax=Methylorubrum thiocyanatum TaxID=47958 RepID=UPI0036508849